MAKQQAINAIREFGNEGRAIANRVCQKNTSSIFIVVILSKKIHQFFSGF